MEDDIIEFVRICSRSFGIVGFVVELYGGVVFLEFKNCFWIVIFDYFFFFGRGEGWIKNKFFVEVVK